MSFHTSIRAFALTALVGAFPLHAEAVPAENATYQAREEEYLRYIENLKTNALARAVKIADLELYLSDERLLKAEGREVKNRFRQEKYRKALEVLRA